MTRLFLVLGFLTAGCGGRQTSNEHAQQREPQTEPRATTGPTAQHLTLGEWTAATASLTGGGFAVDHPVWLLDCGSECTREDEAYRVAGAIFSLDLEAGDYTIALRAPSSSRNEVCLGWSLNHALLGPFDEAAAVDVRAASEELRPLRSDVGNDWECATGDHQRWGLRMASAGPVWLSIVEAPRVEPPGGPPAATTCGEFELAILEGTQMCPDE